jgi:DNA-binding transcriptional MerR regulator
MTKEETYTTVQICEMTGATYRQIDFWVRRNLIPGLAQQATGSGSRRRFTEANVERVRLLLRASRLSTASLEQALELLEP